MGHVVVKLKRPVTLGEQGEPVTELRLRDEVVAGDLRGLEMRHPLHWDDMLKIAGRLAAQPDAVMNKISMEDLGQVTPLVLGFLGLGQETGKTP